MALKECHECKGQVSGEAKTCPHCGAKQKKSVGIFGILVAIGFIAVLVNVAGNEQRHVAKTPEERAAEAAADHRVRQAVRIGTALKSSLRDPGSLEFESIRTNDDATLVCLQYRAKNGFGGTNKEIAVYRNGNGTKSAEAWNKYCTARLWDVIEARHAI